MKERRLHLFSSGYHDIDTIRCVDDEVDIEALSLEHPGTIIVRRLVSYMVENGDITNFITRFRPESGVIAAYTERGREGHVLFSIRFSITMKQWVFVRSDTGDCHYHPTMEGAFEAWHLATNTPLNPYWLSKITVTKLNKDSYDGSDAPVEPVCSKPVKKPAVFGAWS